jgi:hypothetical protein
MAGILDEISEGLDDLLGMRDDLGVALKEVWFVTHVWTGLEPGDGEKVEERKQVLPSPQIVDYSHNLKAMEGGAFEQGDLVLRQISKRKFPDRAEVVRASDSGNVEKFYEVGGELYRVISCTERHLWWNVQVRKITKGAR